MSDDYMNTTGTGATPPEKQSLEEQHEEAIHEQAAPEAMKSQSAGEANDQEIAMSEQNRTPPGMGATPPENKSLEQQLKELKETQAAAESAEAEYAGLEKLVKDTEKAEKEYAKVLKQLQDQEARLRNECGTLKNALEAALTPAVIEDVKVIVSEAVDSFSEAKMARDTAKSLVEKTKKDTEDRAKELEELQAELDKWFKLGDDIGKRLKIAEDLIEEIKKLRNAGGRRGAYWKLALGKHKDVPGQKFVELLLDDHPKIITANQLQENILSAWNKLKSKRVEATQANASLKTAQAELKQTEAIFADVSKNLIKTIVDELAESEADADAA
jgi:chromosome segregation ATPase